MGLLLTPMGRLEQARGGVGPGGEGIKIQFGTCYIRGTFQASNRQGDKGSWRGPGWKHTYEHQEYMGHTDTPARPRPHRMSAPRERARSFRTVKLRHMRMALWII